MIYREFGPTKRMVAAIGQGTWYQDSDDRESAIAAMRKGIDLGMTHIDTAEMYLSGQAEEWVGEAIAGHRDDVFLVSKVLPQNASRTGTVIACEGSLARLGTDRLDCYLLHWRGHHPLKDTFEAFDQLVREGKILSWGVSNFDFRDLREAEEIAGKKQSVSCDQVLYHLQERYIEREIIPYCERRKIAVVAYSPFGHGDFPEKHTPGGVVLQEIAEDHNATPRQVALRFLLRWPGLFALPKASNPDHTEENAGAADLQLTDVEIERIDKAFPPGPPGRPLPVL
ncbi:MAG: Aldo/keto reductase [Bryobacterales bacterium]|nr:Aldo/keto reductase [Bryobacterales bacterium]